MRSYVPVTLECTVVAGVAVAATAAAAVAVAAVVAPLYTYDNEYGGASHRVSL